MQIVMKLYIIAGEKSGDIHGALLLKNLLRLMPGMEVAGLGGQGMQIAYNDKDIEGVFSPFWRGYGRTSRIALF